MSAGEAILVVDDEEDIRHLLATALRRQGYRVSTAGNGAEALGLLQHSPYALIVTDLRMPGMDGLELLRQVGERHPVIRGIVVTGHGTIQSAVEATKLGADNYITKPVVIEEFLNTIRSTLQQGKPLRQIPSANPSEISTLAALTRILAQPSQSLEQIAQSSVDLLAPILQASVRLSIMDPSSTQQVAFAEACAPAPLPEPGDWNETEHISRLSLPEDRKHHLTAALQPSHGYCGVIEAWRPLELPPFTMPSAQLLQVVANQLSIALGNHLAGRSLALTLRELRELSLQTVQALVRAVEMRDRYTAGHSARVSRYAVALAHSLGLESAQIENIRVAALLHDVGKIGVSDLLLNKPGPLDPAERARIEEHPALGCQIVSGVQSLELTMPLILHHQESYNGSGYPSGLAGEQIPYEARILAVADSFEAITATRAYRKARSIRQALEILNKGAGEQWDPLLVAHWHRIVGRALGQDEP